MEPELRVNRWARALQVMAGYMVMVILAAELPLPKAGWTSWWVLAVALACLAAIFSLPIAIGVLREASKGNRWARRWAWVALLVSLPLVPFGLLFMLFGFR